MFRYIIIISTLLFSASCSKDKDNKSTNKLPNLVETIGDTNQGSYLIITGGDSTEHINGIGENVRAIKGYLTGGFFRQVIVYIPNKGTLYMQFSFPDQLGSSWKDLLYTKNGFMSTKLPSNSASGLTDIYPEANLRFATDFFSEKNGIGTVILYEDKKVGDRTIKIYGEIDAVFEHHSGKEYRIQGYFWRNYDFQ